MERRWLRPMLGKPIRELVGDAEAARGLGRSGK
jgi:hypothetical protein